MTADPSLPPLSLPSDLMQARIPRRQMLQLGLWLGVSSLAGCARPQSPTLMAAPETLPLLWRRQLVKPWRFTPLESQQPLLEGTLPAQADLLALPDGWAASLKADDLQPLEVGALRSRLSDKAEDLLNRFPEALAAAMLPVGVSPWVMLIRGEGRGTFAADQGWDALLSPKLAGGVVLPASPRLVISLAERMKGPDSLRRLRSAALAFDDRHALNWLLQGKAKAAVLPLSRCMKTLRSDPRIMALLPDQGAPLDWTLLMRPVTTREPLPQAWVEEAWSSPLLGRLLAEGWLPPLERSALQAMQVAVPDRLRSLVLPPEQTWHQCWNLPPLTAAAARQLADRWQASAP